MPWLMSPVMQFAFVLFNIGAQYALWYKLAQDVLAGKWGVGIEATFSLGPIFVLAGMYNHLRSRRDMTTTQKVLWYLVLVAFIVSFVGNCIAVGAMVKAGVPWGASDWAVVGAALVSFPFILWFHDGEFGNKLARREYFALAIGVATSVVAQLTDAAASFILRGQPMPAETLGAVTIIVVAFLLNNMRLLLFAEGQARIALRANVRLFWWRTGATLLLWAAWGVSRIV